jgi:Cu/Ag efflux pump CusA
VPLVIFIIFVLLFGAFNSVGDALLIMGANEAAGPFSAAC